MAHSPDSITDIIQLWLKEPHPPLQQQINPNKIVTFLHPGYEDGYNVLLSLPCFDAGGIHFGTARIACAILANCRWDGYLSHSRNGRDLAGSYEVDDILPPGRYYFCIHGQAQYPIVPSFEHFVCPSVLPKAFEDAPIDLASDEVAIRDISCRITAESDGANQTAYIIPTAQREWWNSNSMFLRTMNPSNAFDMKCSENALILRQDLNTLWSDHKFVIVPKAGKWVVHLLWNSYYGNFRMNFHNLQLQPLAGISPYFMFSRFALALFQYSPFLKQMKARRVLLVSPGDPSEVTIVRLSGKECQKKFSTRAATHGKRKRQRRMTTVRNKFEGVLEVDDSGEDGDTSDSSDSSDAAEERGRSRVRKACTNTREPLPI